jgi:hypothetical protein
MIASTVLYGRGKIEGQKWLQYILPMVFDSASFVGEEVSGYPLIMLQSGRREDDYPLTKVTYPACIS